MDWNCCKFSDAVNGGFVEVDDRTALVPKFGVLVEVTAWTAIAAGFDTILLFRASVVLEHDVKWCCGGCGALAIAAVVVAVGR